MKDAEMPRDLDAVLARMGGQSCDAGLEGLEDAVFARIAAGEGRRAPLGAGVLAGMGAVLIGVASAGLAPMSASAAPPLLEDVAALAPSTLLSGLLP